MKIEIRKLILTASKTLMKNFKSESEIGVQTIALENLIVPRLRQWKIFAAFSIPNSSYMDLFDPSAWSVVLVGKSKVGYGVSFNSHTQRKQ